MGGICEYIVTFQCDLLAIPYTELIEASRYVATEEGILEYRVNIDERKTFPLIDLR